MLLDKLSFVNKAKLKIAKSVAPIRSASITTFSEIDFNLSHPKLDAILNIEIPTVNIGNTNLTDLLSNPLINDCFTSTLTDSNIYDFTEYNELLNPNVVIENIDFRLTKLSIKGKNYVRKKEIPKANLFSEADDENDTKSKTAKPKIERQYTEKDRHNDFDIFDLIFPALQPPLGNNFDNPISFFGKELKPFQIDGVQFLLNSPNALLGDEMGLGKSIQAITAARVLFKEGKILSATIICPKAVMTDWEKKLWDWAPELKVIKVQGDKNQREILWSTQTHIYICTYESLLKDVFDRIKTESDVRVHKKGHSVTCGNPECRKRIIVPYALFFETGNCPHCGHSSYYPNPKDIVVSSFDLLVLDEVQKTKNPSAKTTKAVRAIKSKYLWALSGTPLENKIEDLITICETIKPDIFSNTNFSSYQNIIDAYKPIFKRRKKVDVLKELPPKITKEVWLDLLPTQREKYDMAEKEGVIYLEKMGKNVTLQHVLALITKLKQICNYEMETGESVKLDYLKEELEELTEQGDKALVFSQYPNETLKRIKTHLEEFKPNIYDGSLSDLERTTIIEDFQNTDNSKLMLLSLKAGNAGITLTRANYVYHFDLWWNPAISAQAVDRTHRIGQTKIVFERLLLAEDTIERRIYSILADKRRLFNEVVDGLSDTNVLQQTLTEDEIFGLFGLKKSKPQLKPKSMKQAPDINSLNPFAFEHFIGELFTLMGYNSRVTKKSNDGGVDIFAKLQTPTGIDEVIIQCKHKKNPNSTVDVGKVRELFGVFSANRKLTKAILVTNGRFTTGAIDFASENSIELIDGTKLQGYVELHY